jgi:hypothetical protein
MCGHILVAWVGEVEGEGIVILLCCIKSGSFGGCGKPMPGAAAVNQCISSVAFNIEVSIVSSLPQTAELLHEATELASHCSYW